MLWIERSHTLNFLSLIFVILSVLSVSLTLPLCVNNIYSVSLAHSHSRIHIILASLCNTRMRINSSHHLCTSQLKSSPFHSCLKFVIHPHSKFYYTWSVIMLVLVLISCFYEPVKIAFLSRLGLSMCICLCVFLSALHKCTCLCVYILLIRCARSYNSFVRRTSMGVRN
jgi:hypothetical protein